MCPSSLTSGVCLTTNCPLRHVSGTKMPLKENGDKSISKQTDQRKSKSASCKDTNTKKSTEQTDFLDAIRLLKIEMMEAMEVKLATLLTHHTTAPATHGSRPQLGYHSRSQQSELPALAPDVPNVDISPESS